MIVAAQVSRSPAGSVAQKEAFGRQSLDLAQLRRVLIV